MKSALSTPVTLFPQTAYGIVEQPITLDQAGRVKFQGSIWKARLYESPTAVVVVGDRVRVMGIQGITLLVAPEE